MITWNYRYSRFLGWALYNMSAGLFLEYVASILTEKKTLKKPLLRKKKRKKPNEDINTPTKLLSSKFKWQNMFFWVQPLHNAAGNEVVF